MEAVLNFQEPPLDIAYALRAVQGEAVNPLIQEALLIATNKLLESDQEVTNQDLYNAFYALYTSMNLSDGTSESESIDQVNLRLDNGNVLMIGYISVDDSFGYPHCWFEIANCSGNLEPDKSKPYTVELVKIDDQVVPFYEHSDLYDIKKAPHFTLAEDPRHFSINMGEFSRRDLLEMFRQGLVKGPEL